jgi:hypothetical protein
VHWWHVVHQQVALLSAATVVQCLHCNPDTPTFQHANFEGLLAD